MHVISHHSRRVLAILTLAFIVRCGAAVWWQGRLPTETRFAFGDSESYWTLGRAIANGQPYEYGEGRFIFRTPGYPALLAPLFWLGGDSPSVLAARFMGAFFGTTAVAAVMVIARQLFDETTSLAAGLIAALFPEAIGASVFILSEAPFTPLMLGQIALWIVAWRQSDDAQPKRTRAWHSALMAGVMAGGATLMRPSWLLFTPFAGIVGLLWVRERRRFCTVGMWLIVGLVVTMSPWWVRNYQVTGRFVATTLEFGASLYDGLNPAADGGSNMDFCSTFFLAQKQADAEAAGKLPGTFEERLDRRLRDASLTWARANPGRVCELAAIKFWRLWNLWPNDSAQTGRFTRMVTALTYGPIMLLAAWGGLRFVRRDWPVVLCLVPAFYLSSLHIVFVSSIRYRQPAMLLLIVLGAAAMAFRKSELRL